MRPVRLCRTLIFLAMSMLMGACAGLPWPIGTPTATEGGLPETEITAEFTPILPESSPTPEAYMPPPTLAPTLTVVTPTAEMTSAPAETATTEPATAEPPPTASLPPTAAPIPTATLLPGAERVTFDAGATSALVEGTLPAHGVVRYVLRAGARQLLQTHVTSAQALSLHVQGANGTQLYDGAADPGYRGNLPLSQDYILTLTAGSAAASYVLQIMIPVRVSFARGTTAGTVEGSVPAYGRNYYVLGAQAGQLMDVNLVPATGVALSIQGLDGTVLLSPMGESSSFRGLLPSTQDYLVTVRSAAGGAHYTLNISIPERVRFAPGAVEATREGKLAAHQQHAYVLGASAGQMLKVKVMAPADTVRISIWGVDGTVLMSGMGVGYEFIGSLPLTQDYIISVRSGDPAVTYTIEMTITS